MDEDKVITKLFSDSKNSEIAWREFLHSYTKLILKIIWRYTDNYDEAMEKYLFICSKLSNNNFQLLKKYNTHKKGERSTFSSWLIVVVNHLCIDEYRTRYGRKRLPKAILRMNDFDQIIFELYYLQGKEIEQMEDHLTLDKDANSKITESLDRINKLVSPSLSKKRLLNKKPIFVEFNEYYQNKLPEEKIINIELLSEKLWAWVNLLPTEEKLIVKYKYWENLSASSIGKVMKLPMRKIYSTLEKILKDLRKSAEHEDVNF